MKLQFEGQRLRMRIDEDELAVLLAGDDVHAGTQVADAFEMRCTLRLWENDDARIEGVANGWFVHLPLASVRELANRLPTRDGLSFEITAHDAANHVTVQFDVDVRDSARRLKARKEGAGH